MAQLNIAVLEAAAEKKHGLPTGMMASIRRQETGGNSKYLDDPSAYHYQLNSQGKRIAGHTGKESTAFGPYGIVESTARKPGYGVDALPSKNITDQIEFASKYLARRIKSAGSVHAGLAGYGEGDKYANSVIKRMNKTEQGPVLASAVSANPVVPAGRGKAAPVPPVVAQAGQTAPTPEGVVPVIPEYQVFQLPQVEAKAPMEEAESPWQAFVGQLQANEQQVLADRTRQETLDRVRDFNLPDFMGALSLMASEPSAVNFNSFKGWGAVG